MLLLLINYFFRRFQCTNKEKTNKKTKTRRNKILISKNNFPYFIPLVVSSADYYCQPTMRQCDGDCTIVRWRQRDSIIALSCGCHHTFAMSRSLFRIVTYELSHCCIIVLLSSHYCTVVWLPSHFRNVSIAFSHCHLRTFALLHYRTVVIALLHCRHRTIALSSSHCRFVVIAVSHCRPLDYQVLPR
jgi:hypothetical protein